MSSYADFFAQDFGSCCERLLRDFLPLARSSERDVTFLLTMAAAGLVIPHERLKQTTNQPPLDRERFSEASEQLRSALEQPIGEWLESTWFGARLSSARGAPDEWPELTHPTPLTRLTPVSDVVVSLRNALAHGNIFTRPTAPATIETIVFVCGYESGRHALRYPLRYISCGPAGLEEFMTRWFRLLTSLEASPEAIAKALDECEAA